MGLHTFIGQYHIIEEQTGEIHNIEVFVAFFHVVIIIVA